MKIIPDPFKDVKRVLMAGKVPHRPVDAARDKRIENLESDVLFLSLLCRSMMQVITDNEVGTVDDIIKAMADADLLDGKGDHALPAQKLADELGVEMPTRDRKQEFTDRIRGT